MTAENITQAYGVPVSVKRVDLQAQLGFVPSGLEKSGAFWKHILFPDYGIAGFDQSFWQQALGYIISAFFALLLIGIIGFAIQRFTRK